MTASNTRRVKSHGSCKTRAKKFHTLWWCSDALDNHIHQPATHVTLFSLPSACLAVPVVSLWRSLASLWRSPHQHAYLLHDQAVLLQFCLLGVHLLHECVVNRHLWFLLLNLLLYLQLLLLLLLLLLSP